MLNVSMLVCQAYKKSMNSASSRGHPEAAAIACFKQLRSELLQGSDRKYKECA